jgi:hypothetical protein
MRRGLWFAAGAGVGVYAMIRGRRAAEALTADGLHDRWQALGVGARMFRDEVATGKAEAEARLRERLEPAYDPTPQLTSGLDVPSLVSREDDSTSDKNEEGPQ